MVVTGIITLKFNINGGHRNNNVKISYQWWYTGKKI